MCSSVGLVRNSASFWDCEDPNDSNTYQSGAPVLNETGGTLLFFTHSRRVSISNARQPLSRAELRSERLLKGSVQNNSKAGSTAESRCRVIRTGRRTEGFVNHRSNLTGSSPQADQSQGTKGWGRGASFVSFSAFKCTTE